MTGTEPTPEDWRIAVAEKRKKLDTLIPSDWRLSEDVIAAHKANGKLIEANIPRTCSFVSDAEVQITENFTATQLLQKLAAGELSSLEVTTAFCKRAAIAQQLTSCLTEMFFDRALERARYLDEYLKREKKPVGPLHGLPISVKDTFCLEGIDTTIGYVSFLQNPPATSNSALVNMLLDLGAVLYVKTNIPQTMMTADSENNIFGRTLNPHNTSLNAGGSSGGEGALVAFRGSVLGVGTDIAGSIRIPALCCGVYGFKPTTQRIPFAGQVSGVMEGLPGLVPSAGPLGHSIDDLELFVSTILKANPWAYDATASGAPWFSPSTSDIMTIGVLPEDEQFPLHPPVRRALDNAIAALTKKGHRIVYLENSPSRNIAYASRLALQSLIYGPHIDHMATSGEPAVKSVAQQPSPMFTGPFPVDMELPIFEKIDALHIKKIEYQEAWRQAWVENKLDAILAPGAQNTAVPHDTYGWPPYTTVWNLLDYPACIIPYGKASKELDPEPVESKTPQPSYIPDAVDGAPCALQIITPRFQDEQCLAAARIIDMDIRA